MTIFFSRVAWGLLGAWLALAFQPDEGLRWLLILAVPWLLGATLLWRASNSIDGAVRAVVSSSEIGRAHV